MESKVFEYDTEKVLIHSLRLYGIVECDSEMLDLNDIPNDKLFMVTIKTEDDKFSYGLCEMKFGEYFSAQKELFNLIKKGESMSIMNIDNLPLFYLSDYKNIITTPDEIIKNALIQSDSFEEKKEKYKMNQIREVIKNMRSAGFLPINGIDSEILDKSMFEYLSELFRIYSSLGAVFYGSFKEMTKTNLEISLKEYPNCKELENVYKTTK